VRTVAIFEALKGGLVLAVGVGLLSLVHRDVEAIAESFVKHLHLNPARHTPRVFLEAAAHTGDSELRTLALLAFAYTVVRFLEAYGLWREKAWAEWFAIISGSLYLPVEVYEIFQHATWMRTAVFVLNAAIVAYMLFVRITERTGRPVAASAPADEPPERPDATPP
jgi:uncharacterized membrane protein (DUF2068 family)